MTTVLWMGPVSEGNLAAVCSRHGASLITLNRGVMQPSGSAISSNAFRDLGLSLGARPLDALLPTSGERVVLAAFSAGGALLEVLLERHASDGRIVGVIGADCYYTSNSSPPVKPGYAAFAGRARFGGPWMLLTSSSNGGPGYLSCSASLGALGRALDLREGWRPSFLPAGGRVRSRGRCAWADYALAFRHTEHATKLAPSALDYVLGGSPPDPRGISASSGSSLPLVLLVGWALARGRA